MPIRFIVFRCLGFVLTAALVIGAAGTASAQLGISRFTIDGGGGTQSLGGTFALGGTIGQPDAGRLSGSSFTLSGGFWSGGGTVTAVESDTPGDGVDLPTAAPLAFRLYPAAPNPISEQTIIAFDLPQASAVRAALYDVSGRLVRILADERMPAGKHQRAWDRRDHSGQRVPSGIYFLRLEAGAHESRQKIVVVS
ncbi:MAG: FlgD immunoglobulin-like domain containing protein [bacterium]